MTEGWQQIEAGTDLGANLTRGNSSWPVQNRGQAHAAFPGLGLMAAEWTIAAALTTGARAIIGREQDEGVLSDTEFIQGVSYCPHRPIDGCHGGPIATITRLLEEWRTDVMGVVDMEMSQAEKK